MPKGPEHVSEPERLAAAEEFMAAAQEHFSALTQHLEPRAHYPLAYYLAGLCIECLFRAYTELVGGEHDAKHNLRRLAESGQFFQERQLLTLGVGRWDSSKKKWRG